MPTLLGKTAVVDDPPAAVAEVHQRHDPLAHAQQHLLVRPVRVGYEMVQRLVPRAHPQRIHVRGHRLHALARQRRHQPGAVPTQTGVPVCVAQAFTEMAHVPLEIFQVFHQGSPFA